MSQAEGVREQTAEFGFAMWRIIFGVVVLGLIVTGVLLYINSSQQHTPQATAPIGHKPALTVAFANVTDGQTVSASITIKLAISDQTRVKKVEYYVDSAFANVTYASPFTWDFDPSKLTPGAHTLQAKVYDTDGKLYPSPTMALQISVAEAPPAPTPTPQQTNTSTSKKTTAKTTSTSGSGGSNTPPAAPDTSAPSTPTNLLLSADDGYTVNLSWTASTDNVGVTGYRVYRDGAQIGTSTTTSYQDQTVVPGNMYSYSLRAVDAAANVSGESTQPSITLVPTSIWIAADTPQNVDSDPSGVEVGVKFRPKANGKVSGVKFYKGAGNTGSHVGALWNSSGTKLASIAFSGESSTGWQQATFTTPVDVTANTTYIVSYTAPSGHISYTSNYFASAGISSQYLSALANGVDGDDGVFNATPGNFPNSSFNHTNYWVDAVFIPNPNAGGPTAKVADNSTVIPGFPGSNNTGIPVGRRLPARDRGIVVYANNVTIENIEITAGNIDINATGATIKNTHVFGFINVPTTSNSATIMDSDIDAGIEQVAAMSTYNLTIRRANIHGGQSSVNCGFGCDIQDSWLHGQYAPSNQAWHLDAFLSNGDHSMLIKHNTLACDYPGNLAGGGCSGDVGLFADFDSLYDITFDGNRFVANTAASYCLYGGYQTSKPFGTQTHNITVINNIFERGSNNQCAQFGPVANFNQDDGTPVTGDVWSNNNWDTGGAVTP